MRNIISRLILGVFTASCLVGVQAYAASVEVPVGRSHLVEVPVDLGEVIVAEPEIADVYVHGKRKVSVIGKGMGITTIRMFNEKSELVRQVDVNVGYDLPMMRKLLKRFLPGENVGVEMVNTNIALVGDVSSATSADRAVQIVSEFIQPTVDRDGDVMPRARDAAPSVINLMNINSSQQVMLRVRVGEVRRSALRQLGLNMQSIAGGGEALFQLASGTGRSLLTGSSLGTFGASSGSADPQFSVGAGKVDAQGRGVSAMLDALERDGVFKVLAEPNLVAISGEQASFLAGGELPIPVAAEGGGQFAQVTIEYKPYGVAVLFTPLVLSENRIRVEVAPEVSEINEDNAVIVNGIRIPSISTRRARTTVELAPGESFMIAGLLQDRIQSTVDQVPGIAELPIISALFRSTAYQRQETELVLAITPYIVDPAISSDIVLPTDEFRPASVMEAFFYGALGSISHGEERISQDASFEGPIGFMVD